MEKRKPHYDLCKIKLLLEDENSRKITSTAQSTASKLGFSIEEMIDLICDLDGSHFYKSMTVETNHKLWQDVYKINSSSDCEVKKIYLKLQIKDEKSVVISFKEDES